MLHKLLPSLARTVGLLSVLIIGSSLRPARAMACTDCYDAPADQCGYQYYYHYHGNDYAFFGIASGQGNYFCHNGPSCSADISCWFGFKEMSDFARVLADGSVADIERIAPYLRLRPNGEGGALSIVACDGSTIIATVKAGARLGRLMPFMVGSGGSGRGFVNAPASAIVTSLNLWSITTE